MAGDPHTPAQRLPLPPLGFLLFRFLPGGEVVPPWGHPAWRGVERWLRSLAAQAVRLYTLFLPAAVLVAWPTDAFFLQGVSAHRVIFAIWRIGLLVWLLPVAWVAWHTRVVTRWPVPFGVAFGSVGLVWTCWCQGAVGSFDSPWPYYAYFALFVATPVPARARDRIGILLSFAGSILLGYCGLRPENLSHPLLPDALLFLGAIGVFAMCLGELTWATAVIRYFERQQVHESRETLVALNATLDQRVREQTAELRELGQHRVRAQEAERSRIAAELHDDLGQQLAAMRFLVSAAQRGEPDRLPGALAEMQELLAGASQSVRTLVSTLRPLVLEQVGLQAACASLTSAMGTHAGISHDFSVEGALDGLSADVNATVYRVLQEALTNVGRHAEAGSVEVELTRGASALTLIVRDDGRGFRALPPPRTDGGGMGLVAMRERAIAVGGDLRLRRPKQGGTEVVLTIPLAPVAP
jgi:two-component system sensor histidine kinase UhpB